MAIDTAAKRKSALDYGLWGLPIPDGTVGQADRQHVLGSYGGILAGELLDSLGFAGFNIRIDSVDMSVQMDSVDMSIQMDTKNIRVVV